MSSPCPAHTDPPLVDHTHTHSHSLTHQPFIHQSLIHQPTFFVFTFFAREKDFFFHVLTRKKHHFSIAPPPARPPPHSQPAPPQVWTPASILVYQIPLEWRVLVGNVIELAWGTFCSSFAASCTPSRPEGLGAPGTSVGPSPTIQKSVSPFFYHFVCLSLNVAPPTFAICPKFNSKKSKKGGLCMSLSPTHTQVSHTSLSHTRILPHMSHPLSSPPLKKNTYIFCGSLPKLSSF